LEKESPILLKRLLDASVDGLFAFDRDCRIVAWNRAMQQISGLSAEEVLGKKADEIFPFLSENSGERCLSNALAGAESLSETHPYGPSGTGVFESHYTALRDEDNNIVGGIAVVSDITARRQAENAAHTAYRQLSFHVESSPLAVIEWDSRGSDRQARQRVAVCVC
jgi:PAS domain S-box-containing protein